MPRLLFQSALGTTVLLIPPLAAALGFGQVISQTTLGQHLNFIATLSVDADEAVPRDCVSADVYAGDAQVSPRNVRAVLETSRDGSQRRVRVTTTTVIDEPVVTIEIAVGCGSRISRRFVTFIDPPSVQLAEAIPDDSQPLPARVVNPQTAQLADIARQADRSRRGRAEAAPAASDEASKVGRPSRASRVADAGARDAARPSPRRRVARGPHATSRTTLVASARPTGPRLRLDPPRAPVAAPLAPATPAAATPTAAPAALVAGAAPIVVPPAVEAAASASESATQALQKERDRIQLLEAGMNRLRSDAAATQQTVSALQARLRQAESDRYANGLVYFLIGTTLLGILVATAFWLLRPRQRRRARWFDAQASQQAKAARSGPSSSVLPLTPSQSAPLASRPAPLSRASAAIPIRREPPATGRSTTSPSVIGGLEVTTVLGPEMARPMVEAAAGVAAPGSRKSGELSMEELIDLEQQAEFFVVLGQDEAAIALLDDYMQGSGGRSPLPYLQLLEIHQRRGDQPAYDRVRTSFNERFNAFAPDWSSDLHFGRTLVEYPQTIARLQSLWPTPLSAMQALDSLLFRRQAADDTFDFPAYRELLFLYSIARELSGNVETDFGPIDLFLPLEGAAVEDPLETDTSNLAVDLDVSNWPSDATAGDLIVSRVRAGR